MNLLETISRNNFLKELYPEGLAEEVLIGHLGFDVGNRFSLNIHTKQRPAKDIAKWGVWGNDYDTVVICLLGQRVQDITISNWDRVGFADLICETRGDCHSISSRGENWHIGLSYRSLVFQECRTYSE